MGEAALLIAAIASFFVNTHKKLISFQEPKFYISVTTAFREREKERESNSKSMYACIMVCVSV
jgi:hypothetical protein